MDLKQRLSVLDHSGIPSWVFDLDLFKFHWANDKALELWRATSREELLARDFSDMSVSTRTRVRGYIEGFRRGVSAVEQWTLYPRGKPTTVTLHFSGIELDDGRIATLIQAVPANTVDSELVRGIEALRHTSVLVALVDGEGAILMRNPAAQRAIDVELAFDRWFIDPGVASEILRAGLSGQVLQRELAVRTTAGARWVDAEARPMLDVVTGERSILVHMVDQTARHAAEQANKANALMIEQQRQQILALLAPVLDVAPGTLAVPIIGSLDPGYSAQLSERLLAAVAARSAQRVVIDLTGADALDATSVEVLMRLLRAVRLLGALPVVTGLSPRLAATVAARGLDLAGVLTLRSLREALALRA